MNRSLLALCLVLLIMLLVSGIASASPDITGISPSSGPNNGTIKVRITGSGLDTVDQVRLNKCKLKSGDIVNVPPFLADIETQSSSVIIARFDITGKRAGSYELSVRAIVDGQEQWDHIENAFDVYQAGTTTAPTTTTVTGSVTTEPTASSGDNSVFFETNPNGATIYVDGDEVGTSTFTYYTDMDGIHDVLVKKLGYEDYSDRVTIVEDSRVRFYAQLTPLSAAAVTTALPAASGTTAKTVTTNRKSTLKIPTPLGTFSPPAEEAPVSPAVVLLAAGIGAVFVVMRRR